MRDTSRLRWGRAFVRLGARVVAGEWRGDASGLWIATEWVRGRPCRPVVGGRSYSQVAC